MDNSTKFEISMEKVLNELDDISTRINKLKSTVLRMYHQIDDTSTHSSDEEARPTHFKSEVEKLDSESFSSSTDESLPSENSIEASEEDSGSDSFGNEAEQVSDGSVDGSYSD